MLWLSAASQTAHDAPLHSAAHSWKLLRNPWGTASTLSRLISLVKVILDSEPPRGAEKSALRCQTADTLPCNRRR